MSTFSRLTARIHRKSQKRYRRQGMCCCIDRTPEDVQAHVSKIQGFLTDKRVRAWSCAVLGRLESRAKSTVPKLTPLLNDAEPSVRFASADALWKIGKNQQAIDFLVGALADAKLRA